LTYLWGCIQKQAKYAAEMHMGSIQRTAGSSSIGSAVKTKHLLWN